VNIIDQCVAQGVPFAREYGGTLANRSFGGAQVSRTFYARGQTGQQLLIGAYQALERQVATGQVKMITRTEMVDLIVIDGKARGIVTRNLACALARGALCQPLLYTDSPHLHSCIRRVSIEADADVGIASQ
jgi:succinate dehydrogenase/fumarate reductase flavoprotein subunit